jgi:2',3'-cyclic-nucleotide 2'-phosphodiesterase (5'-nucleotidase family)
VIEEKLARESLHLIVDNGNFCRASRRKEDIKTEYLSRAMAMMGYDAINLAREEAVLGADRILEVRDMERMPFVSSNIYRSGGDRPLVAPFLIKRLGGSRFLGFRRGGIRVAIVGLASPTDPGRLERSIAPELTIAEPEAILRATMEKLKGHCDLVVVLSDMGLREAIAVAQEVDGIDLFFVNYGAREKHSERVGETIFIYPARLGKQLGDVELFLDEQRAVTSYQVEWTLLDEKVPDDERLAELVAEYKAELDRERNPDQKSQK